MPITNPAAIMYTNMSKAADAMNEQRSVPKQNKGLLASTKKMTKEPESGKLKSGDIAMLYFESIRKKREEIRNG